MKFRHRGSMGDFAGSDQEPLEEKRPPNPPPMKPSSESVLYCVVCAMIMVTPYTALKSVGVKVSRPPPALGSGDSDYDSGDEGKRRKGYRGDHDMSRRYVTHQGMQPEAVMHEMECEECVFNLYLSPVTPNNGVLSGPGFPFPLCVCSTTHSHP